MLHINLISIVVTSQRNRVPSLKLILNICYYLLQWQYYFTHIRHKFIRQSDCNLDVACGREKKAERKKELL